MITGMDPLEPYVPNLRSPALINDRDDDVWEGPDDQRWVPPKGDSGL